MRPPCSIDGCDRISHGHGYCTVHLSRLRKYGDPLAGPPIKAGNGDRLRFLMSLVGTQVDECIPWPFQTNPKGRGTLLFEGRMQSASRVMCILEHGPPPDPTLESAHSCGKGHLGCMNPRHLRWRTVRENALERVDHGTDIRGARNPQCKLDEVQVRAMRSEHANGIGTTALGRKYGVSIAAASLIVHRKKWAWLD